MAITKANANHLVNQLQNAHRISVAFYRRFLPLLDNLANEVGCAFSYWHPLETERVCLQKTRPSSKWAWDFIPLFASHHVYWRTASNTVTPTDAGLAFSLYIDDNFSTEKRKQKKISGQPDAVTLPIGNAVLQLYIYRPLKKSKQTFSDLWKNTPEPEIGEEMMQPLGENMQGIGFEWPLADILYDTTNIRQILKKHIG